ncbi:MAG: preprotein translocase subunit SecG [Pedosphaera sp.]|nr:preprotein translocase subunit SecG [Pedosphaera sp.]
MLSFLIGLFTVALILNCLLLILLVLVQLPKKEAGAGLAFGGGATDALFGAGSGNVLTKITKYSAGLFFGLALFVSVLNTHAHREPGSELKEQMAKPAATSSMPAAPTTTPSPTAERPAPAVPLTIGTNTSVPTLSTNAPAK